MGRLTTHVLDTAAGRPGAGIALTLARLDGGRQELLRAVTNPDGRCDRPLLEGAALERGRYELVFAAGDYFRAQGLPLAEPLFVDEVVLRFGISDPAQHYHVPLLLSPWSYATYRGS
jgi:5-hydroxyisourate hydrolase